jgi:hypothetical protein
MSGYSNSGEAPPVATIRAKNEALPLWAWLDAAPVAWLVLLISAYAFLAFADLVPTKRPVPGIPEADRLALPFLVLTVSAGIIRYFCLWARAWFAQCDPQAPASGNRDTA